MVQKMRKKLGCKKGFTLIELIVVIAILGILALIAIPKLNGVQESARKATDIANAKAIANVISVGVATAEITADAGTIGDATKAVLLPSSGVIFNGFPNGYPVGQTTTVSKSAYRYCLDVETGSVEIYLTSGTTNLQVYPKVDAAFK